MMIVNSQMKALANGGEVPLTAAALPLWTATAIPCIKKSGSLASALILQIISLMASGRNTPDVSMATGTKNGWNREGCTSGFLSTQVG